MSGYKVYMHIFPNRKLYIGVTKQRVNHRWNNGKGYTNNKYMANAINKYGWENIEHKVLFDNLTKEEAEQKEIELISKYKSNNKQYGYNILEGGNVSNGVTKDVLEKMSKNTKRLWANPKYRQHMVEIHLGKKASIQTKAKMSKSNPKIWLGKHLTNDMKEKISKHKKGQIAWNKGTKGIMKPNKTTFKHGEIHSITKKVKCIETGIIYDTINSASRQTNVNATCIINVCKRKQITAGGFHWEYA